MAEGSVEVTSWRRKLVAFILVAVILVCAALLVFVTLNKPWTVVIQVISAVAGAALGSTLSADSARTAVRAQARPAVRRIFDQITRLQALVVRVEAYGDAIQAHIENGKRSDPSRSVDWFNSVAYNIREEINSTATAAEDWGDLTPDVYSNELERYRTRESRMPNSSAATKQG